MIRFVLHKKLKAVGGEMQLLVEAAIERGQLLALYGESGAGKTSILRMLAGLMKPESGLIEVHGDTWLDSKKDIDLKPQKRKTGFVFQDYALFPNMTVRQNLEFALDKKQDCGIVDELIEMVELGDLQHRKPETLSGGQQQRTALARALVRRPALLLLDEPLSALDYSMRSKLQDYILEVHRRFNLTTILVSHEISEVFKMADRVLAMEQGKVVKQGKPMEIFADDQPDDNSFKLIGDVVEINRRGNEAFIKILVGQQLLNMELPIEKITELKLGDKIMVGAALNISTIKKIENAIK